MSAPPRGLLSAAMVRAMRRLLFLANLLGAVAPVAASGCTAEPRPLTWEIVPGSAALAAEIVLVETSLREGTCDGPVVFQSRVERMGRQSSVAPPRLSPGPYAFVAIGASADCEWVAAGCTVVELPSTASTTTVSLLEAPRQSYCAPGATCAAGICDAADGGPPPFDGSFRDSAVPADTGLADTGPMDTGPSCSDGVHNGDEAAVDCGGSCPPCPTWNTGSWGSCNRGTESRSVTCLDADGATVADGLCTASRPSSSRDCAWVEYVGFGGTTGSSLGDHWLTIGSCSDPVACTGCTGGVSDSDCSDHCLAKAEELRTAISCARTACTRQCRVYSGHDFTTSGSQPIWWGDYGP